MELWEKFLKQLEKELGKPAVDRWLRPLQVSDYDAGNLYLTAENTFQALWFEKQIRKIAKERFLNEAGRSIKIHLDALDVPKQISSKKEEIEKNLYTSTPLAPDCTFDRFIVDQESSPLIQFLKEIDQESGNPLFLFGGAGVGKTHLLMAMAAHLTSQGHKVFFTHAETFTEHVVNAIRSGNVAPLRKTYRTIDTLLLDDVHCLARKAATQEEFFHTFNSLYNQGCQIILSSQYPPRSLTEIEPRLISRFEWGILFEIPSPSLDLLHNIVSKRAETLGLPLSNQLLCELIKIFKSSPKAVLRALDALALRRKGTHSWTREDLENCLSDLISQEKARILTPERIVQLTAHHFKLRPEDLLGKSQTKGNSLARQIAIFLCRHELQVSFISLSKLFKRDHSTIMASVRVVEEKKSKDPMVARALFELKELFSAKS
jgi:chromosomal replication initiator protein